MFICDPGFHATLLWAVKRDVCEIEKTEKYSQVNVYVEFCMTFVCVCVCVWERERERE